MALSNAERQRLYRARHKDKTSNRPISSHVSINPESINVKELPCFSLLERLVLPQTKAVYFVLNDNGEVIYIGSTTNLRKRFYKHHHEEEFLTLTQGKIAWLTLEPSIYAEDIESRCIYFFKPKWNRIPLREDGVPVTNMERQQSYRDRRKAGEPVRQYVDPPKGKPSRVQRWQEAVETLRELQTEYQEWLDNLPESLQDSTLAEKLQTVCDLDIDELDVDLPKGFGRD